MNPRSILSMWNACRTEKQQQKNDPGPSWLAKHGFRTIVHWGSETAWYDLHMAVNEPRFDTYGAMVGNWQCC